MFYPIWFITHCNLVPPLPLLWNLLSQSVLNLTWLLCKVLLWALWPCSALVFLLVLWRFTLSQDPFLLLAGLTAVILQDPVTSLLCSPATGSLTVTHWFKFYMYIDEFQPYIWHQSDSKITFHTKKPEFHGQDTHNEIHYLFFHPLFFLISSFWLMTSSFLKSSVVNINDVYFTFLVLFSFWAHKRMPLLHSLKLRHDYVTW